MPSYQVFRMKENARQQFRWAPHLSGVTGVKPKDYEPLFEVEAASPYAAWHELKGTDRELMIGDVLESSGPDLRILKYIGFEEARWIVPEQKPVAEPLTAPPQPAQTLG